MFSLVEQDGKLFLTINEVTHELSQDQFDHVASLMMPHVTPKDRHIFTMFERMTSEDRSHVAMLLNP